jgi:hypothetical protein
VTDYHHPRERGNLRWQFWFRVTGISVVVVLTGLVFFRVYPMAWMASCETFETRSTDAAGRNVVIFENFCLPLYWYYIIGFCGAVLSAIITLRRVTVIRLVMFIIVCDLMVTWIGGTALLAWDRYLPHAVPGPSPAAFWASLPLSGFFVGVTFGNIFTLGFPVWAAALASFCILGGERALLRKG